jgi:hypothetical protein
MQWPGASIADELQHRLETLESDRVAWAVPSSSADELHLAPDEDWPAGGVVSRS